MGAAVATVGGQIVSAVLAAVYLFRMKAVRLDRDSFRFRPRLMKRVLALGSASFLSQISIVLSMAATINMCVKYGAKDAMFSQPEYAQIPTAVAGIVSKFFQIIISVSAGLAAGCIPIAGYNIGARRSDRVLGLMKRLMSVEALVGLAASAVFLLFPDQLMLLFGSKTESVNYTQFAVWFIRCQLCLLPLACVNKGAFIFLQSLGKSKESSILSVTREIVFWRRIAHSASGALGTVRAAVLHARVRRAHVDRRGMGPCQNEKRPAQRHIGDRPHQRVNGSQNAPQRRFSARPAGLSRYPSTAALRSAKIESYRRTLHER